MNEDLITYIISLGGIGMQIFIVVILLAIFLKQTDNKFFSLIKKYTMHIVFLISLSSMLLSLYYSNIANLEPCLLCWWQRVFMYPLAFMFTWAIWKKDWNVVPYAMILSIIGFFIALYHNYIQYFPKQASTFCSIEATISCTENYFTTFGYITIPLLSLTSFSLIILLLYLYFLSYIKNRHKNI